MYNGGIGEEQLSWLEVQLKEATQAGQRVVCFGHIPIHPSGDEGGNECLVWNYTGVSIGFCVRAVLKRSRLACLRACVHMPGKNEQCFAGADKILRAYTDIFFCVI